MDGRLKKKSWRIVSHYIIYAMWRDILRGLALSLLLHTTAYHQCGLFLLPSFLTVCSCPQKWTFFLTFVRLFILLFCTQLISLSFQFITNETNWLTGEFSQSKRKNDACTTRTIVLYDIRYERLHYHHLLSITLLNKTPKKTNQADLKKWSANCTQQKPFISTHGWAGVVVVPLHELKIMPCVGSV